MAIPPIGLGTYKLEGKNCIRVVRQALDLGYRHIDTAHMYENHKTIRKAIEKFDRRQLYLTSKMVVEQVNLKKITPSVEKACKVALKELGVEFLDLYLLHWPDHTLPLSKIFAAMQALKEKGLVKEVGVSNFNVHHLRDLFKDGVYPAFNQVEFHPYLYQKELLNFCRQHQITLVAYRPFGKGELLKEPLFIKIGKKHGKSATQVILRWLVQKQIPTIPKASSLAHLKANLDIFDFTLSTTEVLSIDRLNRNQRFCKPDAPAFTY
jgi:2,5-diketo-D-gluconate reductase B